VKLIINYLNLLIWLESPSPKERKLRTHRNPKSLKKAQKKGNVRKILKDRSQRRGRRPGRIGGGV